MMKKKDDEYDEYEIVNEILLMQKSLFHEKQPEILKFTIKTTEKPNSNISFLGRLTFEKFVLAGTGKFSDYAIEQYDDNNGKIIKKYKMLETDTDNAKFGKQFNDNIILWKDITVSKPLEEHKIKPE